FDGVKIKEEKVIELTNHIIDIIDKMPDKDETHPTYFEITTAIAFQYFSLQKLDFALIEVGMGGRLDATNVITPELCIITSIGLEHTDILGDTYSKIAMEKAGIIKPSIPVVTGVSVKEAQDVIINICKEKNAELFIYNRDFSSKINSLTIERSDFDYNGVNKHWKNLSISMIGEHQIFNSSLAICSIELLAQAKLIDLNDECIYKGLLNAYWTGRMELVSKNPYILLDGAHNPDGAEILNNNLKKYFSDKRIYMIIGIMKDKDKEKILKNLCQSAYEIILTTISYERASNPYELYTIAEKYSNNIKVFPTMTESINYARTKAGQNDLICISGSLFIVGEAISILKRL
ncbi:MAG: bifunctional folylpolyglutamate synthase/dihydrofolate synthase, partial [Candidatus Firestonebacteria bacterium]|nr:bifunctional folylpolyglutamate synthase/dihydrofolate synthase [Candidatus Firestonebacteria bacterium]